MTSVTRRALIHRSLTFSTGFALLPLMGGCGDSDNQDAALNSDALVAMTDTLRFEPEHVTIKAGGTVTWRNQGAMGHTATGDPNKVQQADHVALPTGASAWNSGLIRKDEEWQHRFDVPGEYRYFCVPHEAAGMIGRITVTEAS